jgi:hypothetical protein
MALPLLFGIARGDELRSAREAVDRALKNDDGGGLVARQSACPQSADDGSEYVTRVEIMPVGDSADATLIDSAMCGGGNKHGQYLVVTRHGKSRLVTDAEIGDMSFLGEISRVDGNKVFLSGNRWLPDDPHCCPSRRAVLEYDIETGKHSLKLTSRRLGN